MKKFFLVLAVAATMMSCFSSEFTPDTAIKFDAAVKSNSTRATDPAITSLNIDKFDVWAFMNEPSGILFNQQRVIKDNGAWTYSPVAFWNPGRTYYFTALAPVDCSNIEITLANAAAGQISKEGLGSVTFTNVDGSHDLIYAAPTTYTTPATVEEMTTMPLVGLNFKHLLSKVRFSFKNMFLNNETLVVSGIKMTAKNKASIDLTQPTYSWVFDAAAQDVVLNFGDANGAQNFEIGQVASCDINCLTIPADNTKEYAVTFNVTVYHGDQAGNPIPVSTTIKGVEFKIGTQYNFTVELAGDKMGLKPIVFGDPTVEEWVTDTNPEQEKPLPLQ